MTETDTSDDKDPKLQKILRDLPHVGASPDFEQRLQRRLTEARAGNETEARSGRLPFRIPAFGYSIVAVAVVGFLSYYILLRTRFETPPSSPQIISLPRPADTARGGFREETPVNEPEQVKPVPRKALPPKKPLETQSAQAEEPPAPIAPQKMKDEAVQRSGQGLISPPPSAAEKAKPAAAVEAPAPTAEQGAVQSDVRGETRIYRSQTRLLKGGVVDSAAIKDSLRLDSLRRGLKRTVKPRGE